MPNLARAFCPNPECPHHGKTGLGNVSVRGRTGRNRERAILYCRTCGRRFSPARGGPLFSIRVPDGSIRLVIRLSTLGMGIRALSRSTGLSTDTVSKVLARVGGHCLESLDGMMDALHLPPGMEGELLDFMRARHLARTGQCTAPGPAQPPDLRTASEKRNDPRSLRSPAPCRRLCRDRHSAAGEAARPRLLRAGTPLASPSAAVPGAGRGHPS
ncbi:MAG: hypothetical protein LBQ79_07290 [Deltaproteobacteria bacterium]|jgi:transposase-like protein|nr:hypothetical protein [Deltaproteobacteria bacterium]